MKKAAPTLLLAALALVTLSASAGDDCDVPIERWQSREAVQQMAVRQGWKVQQLRIDDGCYELRATDAQGRRIKAKIDPETLQIVKIKHKERSREREREREHRGDAPPAAQDAPATSPIFTPGAPPRAQID